MNEAMTQPQAEVDAAFNAMMAQPSMSEQAAMNFDDVASQMAMDGMMAAVRAMQNYDNTRSSMQDYVNVVSEVSLATPSLSMDNNVDAYRWQLHAAAQDRIAAEQAAASNSDEEEDADDDRLALV